MSDYRNAISRNTIERYISEGRSFDMNISSALSKAWEYATNNVGTTLLIGLVFSLLNIIAPWMMSGLYIGMYEERSQGKKMEVNTLFRGFDHGGTILTYFLLYLAIIFGVMIAFAIPIAINIFAFGESGFMILVGAILYIAFIIGMIILQSLLFFSIHLITFAGMDGSEAMKSSVQLLKNSKLNTFLFLFIVGIVGSLGVFACGIGMLFTMPLVYMAYYHVFAESFLLEEGGDDEMDNILDHLV